MVSLPDTCAPARFSAAGAAAARLFARDSATKVYVNGLKIAQGYEKKIEEVIPLLKSLELSGVMTSFLEDMDRIAAELAK